MSRRYDRSSFRRTYRSGSWLEKTHRLSNQKRQGQDSHSLPPRELSEGSLRLKKVIDDFLIPDILSFRDGPYTLQTFGTELIFGHS